MTRTPVKQAAKESKAIRRMRQKVREKLKAESKAMGKRTLKSVEKIIQLQVHPVTLVKKKARGRPPKKNVEQKLHELRARVQISIQKVKEQMTKIPTLKPLAGEELISANSANKDSSHE